MKLLNFENRSSGKLPKIEHYFRKQRDLKIDVSKKVLIFFNEKKIKKIQVIFDIEN